MTNGFHKSAQASHEVASPLRRETVTSANPRSTELEQESQQTEPKDDETPSDA